VAVWDDKEGAQGLADYLNANVRDVVEVKPVTSFFPPDMCEADHVWMAATAKYLS
jgi:hypothetical protein